MRARLEAPGERGALTELWGAAFPRQCRAPGAMDSETRQLRALEAEVAALQRECTMLPEPWEKTSRAGYVAPVPHLGPARRSTRPTWLPHDSSGLRLPARRVLNSVVGDLPKCQLESVSIP